MLQAALAACAPSPLRLGVTETNQTVFVDVGAFLPPSASEAEARPKKRAKTGAAGVDAVAASSSGVDRD